MQWQWLVGVEKAEPNDRMLEIILEQYKFEVVTSDYESYEVSFYLYSEKFLELNNRSDIWRYMNNFLQDLDRASQANGGPKYHIALGNVLEKREEVYISCSFASVHMCQITDASVKATISDENGPITKEELERRRMNAKRRAEEQKALSIVNYVAAQESDGNVKKVVELLGGDLNPVNAYKIFELIRHDIKKNMNKRISLIMPDDEKNRFTRSVNNPQVVGDEARHGVFNHEPPPNPMSLDEIR
ncbi:MAG: hypothetical protein AAF639_12940 [Chloroflexota bacterium]